MKIGFIGLGTMGKPMVRNLMKAGHEVWVLNRSQPAIDQMVTEGAHEGTSYAQIGANCPVIITMVPNAPDVKKVLLGHDGVLNAAKPGTIIIDMSSISPNESRIIFSACKEKGVRMMDAPVTGGEAGAIAGTLSILCGGEETLFADCRELLSAMGTTITYCGPSGAGNSTKLVNQVIVAGNIAVMAEGFMLAKKSGIDPKVVYQAINGGLAGSAIMNARGMKILNGDTSPSFSLDLHHKDLTNALSAAHECGSPMLLSSQIYEMFSLLKSQGMGKLDHSALSKYYEILTGDTLASEHPL